jgi:hypothetical protein
MKSARTLVLKRESLTELTPESLAAVVGAQATLAQVCATKVTVLVYGCASDPRFCHYATDVC